MKTLHSFSFVAALVLTARGGHAQEAQGAGSQASSDATTRVTISSDWPGTALYRHRGTSLGQGDVGGTQATISVFHFEKICRAPCVTTLATEGDYFVDAPAMNPRSLALPAGTRSVDLRVKAAPQWPIAVSAWSVALGGTAALTGGLMWGIMGSMPGKETTSLNSQGKFETTTEPRSTSAFQAITIVGAGVLVAGIVGLVTLPRTHVETVDGTTFDARASTPSSGPRFTGNGFVF